ncbi:MAG: MarR family transcriptional regulator [Rhodospirillaceae bacterium]|nr:MAG: MarR family transcriptional regulator [Rhodospirillaceae bacterium]
MVDYLTPAELKGRVIEQRAALRRNLVNRLFRLGNGVQAQSQQLLALVSDLSLVHFRILLRLSEAGTQNVQGLSELLGANRSLVSRALPDLRDKGLINLIKNETDKRQIFVSLTDEGNAIVEEHRDPIRARDQAMRSAFKPEEFEQLVEYFDRLDAITSVPAADFIHSPDSSDHGDEP